VTGAISSTIGIIGWVLNRLAAVSTPKERGMPDLDYNREHTIRETAYFIWEQEGRPDGRAHDHWLRAMEQAAAPPAPAPRKPPRRAAKRSTPPRVHIPDHLEDEEKVLAGRPDVNMPALLTKDVPGG